MVAALSAVLITFGVFEYRWFSNIARGEYEKTRSSLALSINRTASREMESIFMLGRWIDQAALLSGTSVEQAKSEIILLHGQFGPSSENPMVSAVGYLDTGSGSAAAYWYSGAGWSRAELPDSLVQELSGKELRPQLLQDGNDLYYLSPIGWDRMIAARIDLGAYIADYIFPEIEDAHPEMRVEWVLSPDDPEYSQTLDRAAAAGYTFNPLSSLVSDPFILQETQVFPLFMMKLEPFGGEVDFRDHIIPGGGFSRLFEGVITLEPGQDIIGVRLSSIDYYGGNIERTLSIIFLAGIFLIGLIGFICILLLYQMNRVQNQREKEREFTASITHELRTPLTVIQSASDNLAADMVPAARVPSYGELIKQQTHRLGTMIENILAYSRVEGKRRYTRQESEIHLGELFSRLREHADALAGERSVAIDWNVRNLDVTVSTDTELLELIVSNLISNGIYHAYRDEPGSLRAEILFIRPDLLRCVIEDDGIGIPLHEQKAIWDSYYRGTQSKESQERGSGLGLSIVKRNVSILGGKIRLDSPYPRLDGTMRPGCRFEVEIPCRLV